MVRHKKIKQAMNSLYQKYPDFSWGLDILKFFNLHSLNCVEKMYMNESMIRYTEEYLFYVSTEQVEEEIMHMMFHLGLYHNERFLMYPDVELRDAIMDFQVACMMYDIGMLKQEKKECFEYLIDTVCQGKCDFRLYHELQKDKERKEHFLNYMTVLHWDNHEKWKSRL